jgi:cobalt transporter subunit CbtA
VPTFRAIVFAAVLAGLLGGLLLTLLQQFGTTPLIQEAELLEPAVAAAQFHGHTPAAAWAPRDGLERTAFTLLANTVTGVGFALLLVAGFALAGRPFGWPTGLAWGLAGFAAFALAPSLGLPPALPGTAEAPLGARQLWWAATAAATASGLALLAFRRGPAWAVAALALLVAPHLIGAPHAADGGEHGVPETLAHRFVAAAIVTSLLFWLALGALSAVIFRRLARA